MVKSNMYQDSVKQWNVVVGCRFDCLYCRKSFQAQMKRQLHNCKLCYDYEPHFHPERLRMSLPNTKGDQFIWVCSSGDIYFAKREWMEKILERVKELAHKTFFFQSKHPAVFFNYDFPENTILGTTIETNREIDNISLAPSPFRRFHLFSDVDHPRKFITIEPIMEFDMDTLVTWIKYTYAERVYVGYDTKKNGLPEPSREKVEELITKLEEFTTVKRKYMK